jgi:hypothetical protein
MQTRSRTVEMPSGLSLPLAFGMNTLLIGSSPPRDVVRKQVLEALKALKVDVIRGPGKNSERRNPTKKPRIHVRCHVAVPFGSTDDDDRIKRNAPEAKSSAPDDRPPRSDEIRNAFNSPFWPHVLATTSVGQEGLDFHTWCSRILHWDLCSSPLELEQREGRIQRYAGLAVRRRLARMVESEVAPGAGKHGCASRWDVVETLANERYLDASGLSPWWVLQGAHVNRFVFNLPQSRDLEKFKLLKEQRLIYRLTLGQPNQEGLVEFLATGGPALTKVLQPLALDLSAFGRTTASNVKTFVQPVSERNRDDREIAS